MFLPHLSGGGCPTADPLSLGAFAGLSNRATKHDMLRAIIEGLDFQFLDIVRTMRADLGVPCHKLIVVGGAARNKFWMQNKADMMGGLFGTAIEVSEVEEATLLGAAMLAGIGVGLYRSEADAFEHVHKAAVTFEPDAAAAQVYARLYPIYRQLYPALRPVSHALSQL
jgi:xylulokinase